MAAAPCTSASGLNVFLTAPRASPGVRKGETPTRGPEVGWVERVADCGYSLAARSRAVPTIGLDALLPMKTTTLLLILAAFGMAAFSAGCAGTPTRESTGEYIDNSAITAKVKAAFVRDELVKALDVSVETFRGVVQLSGFVNTQAQKDRAAQIARTIEGVTDVQNNLVVK